MLFLLLVVAVLRQWRNVQVIIKQPKYLLMLVVSATLLGFNWGLFIWAVNNDHMLDASLGYYINPLLNVLLGVTFYLSACASGSYLRWLWRSLGWPFS